MFNDKIIAPSTFDKLVTAAEAARSASKADIYIRLECLRLANGNMWVSTSEVVARADAMYKFITANNASDGSEA